ncbi:MAG: hypothetical protein Q8R70_13190 [Methanoregula sp.]|nr:hypothetical protein [Methanoregula sp.]
MTDSHKTRSSLSRLVLFIFCLAFAGSFVATVHYLVVDHPAQNIPMAPENGKSCVLAENQRMDCVNGCYVKHPEWDFIGRNICANWCLDHIPLNC